MKNADQLKSKLKKIGSSTRAEHAKRFFKTGPGQYGEGDIFVGVKVPVMRALVKSCLHFEKKEIAKLLNSKIHEDRFCGLVILVEQFKRSKDEVEAKQIFNFYLQYKSRINNWDLVDVSTAQIVGNHCLKINDVSVIKRYIQSAQHWDRRIAMVATLAFIRKNQLDIAFYCAQKVLNDKEDLMHKASGWMLREAGKRNSQALLDFIQKHGSKMPRTMLRYSIEKFSPAKRKKILLETKSKTVK